MCGAARLGMDARTDVKMANDFPMVAPGRLRRETFAKLRSRLHIVIPAQAGIRYCQGVHGFRVKPGMTEKDVFQRFRRVFPPGGKRRFHRMRIPAGGMVQRGSAWASRGILPDRQDISPSTPPLTIFSASPCHSEVFPSSGPSFPCLLCLLFSLPYFASLPTCLWLGYASKTYFAIGTVPDSSCAGCSRNHQREGRRRMRFCPMGLQSAASITSSRSSASTSLFSWTMISITLPDAGA